MIIPYTMVKMRGTMEIHKGSCSMHAGPRSVVAKAIRLGYFWPTMHKDAQDMIRKCSDCQIHRPVTRHPQQPLTPITAPWPFYKWGIDIAGPFPEGPGKVKFLIVAMDYFTKWIEAKVVATITGGQEFVGELAPINRIPPGIFKADFDSEEDIHLIEKLLNNDSSPRPPEELNSKILDAIIESFSPSPIPVEDSDSLMEEIDIFLASDDSIPPGMENDDYDSEGDVLFLEGLLNDDSISLPEYESFQFDFYNVPSSPRPPEKPPDDDDVYFDVEPDTRILTTKVVDDIFDNSTR
nr:reverse transcriptase domain-containing protein [Tanacetum cinerariifolium]